MGDFLLKLLVGLAVVLVFAVIFVPLMLLNGWVLSWLWLWFVVPLGLPALGLAHSIGIAGIVGFLTRSYEPTQEGETWNKISFGVLAPLVSLGVGYIVHLFM